MSKSIFIYDIEREHIQVGDKEFWLDTTDSESPISMNNDKWQGLKEKFKEYYDIDLNKFSLGKKKPMKIPYEVGELLCTMLENMVNSPVYNQSFTEGQKSSSLFLEHNKSLFNLIDELPASIRNYIKAKKEFKYNYHITQYLPLIIERFSALLSLVLENKYILDRRFFNDFILSLDGMYDDLFMKFLKYKFYNDNDDNEIISNKKDEFTINTEILHFMDPFLANVFNKFDRDVASEEIEQKIIELNSYKDKQKEEICEEYNKFLTEKYSHYRFKAEDGFQDKISECIQLLEKNRKLPDKDAEIRIKDDIHREINLLLHYYQSIERIDELISNIEIGLEFTKQFFTNNEESERRFLHSLEEMKKIYYDAIKTKAESGQLFWIANNIDLYIPKLISNEYTVENVVDLIYNNYLEALTDKVNSFEKLKKSSPIKYALDRALGEIFVEYASKEMPYVKKKKVK